MPTRRGILAFVCVSCCLLLAGCGDAVTVLPPSGPNEYLKRTSEFFATATVLFGESRLTWGQGIRSMYYAGLTLARMNDLHGFQRHDGSVHEEAWRQAPKAARKFFQQEFRPLRNRYDYDVALPPDEPLEEDVLLVAEKSPAAFAALFISAGSVIERRYSCEQPHQLCGRCKYDGGTMCLEERDRKALDGVKAQAAALFGGPLGRAAELARESREPAV